MNNIVIATRESRLALWQAEHVKTLLGQRLGLAASLLGMSSDEVRLPLVAATEAARVRIREAMVFAGLIKA